MNKENKDTLFICFFIFFGCLWAGIYLVSGIDIVSSVFDTIIHKFKELLGWFLIIIASVFFLIMWTIVDQYRRFL